LASPPALPLQRRSRRSLPTPGRAKPAARIDGVLIAEMASGLEALVGVVNDPAFGPCVAVGLGGVLTEVLGDIAYRIAPFDIETARDMIAELKGARLFQGYRGAKPADAEALAELLVNVSRMAIAPNRGCTSSTSIRSSFGRPAKGLWPPTRWSCCVDRRAAALKISTSCDEHCSRLNWL
jgi:hypothetical protein